MSNNFYKLIKFVATSQSFSMLISICYVSSFNNENFGKRKTE